ncbi:MAG: ATP-binding cassette domain-containing protein [Caulobacteraceae bacterium]
MASSRPWRAFSLAIEAGSFTALLGGSGSGKTTALKTINGLIVRRRARCGCKVSWCRPSPGPALRRRIGYVFQEVGLFPHMTVAENIAIGPRLAGWDKARIAPRVAELLKLVALPADVGGRLPTALSGGQRQRVGVRGRWRPSRRSC